MENASRFVVVMKFILRYFFFYSYIKGVVFWLSSKYYNSFSASKCICKEEKTVCKKIKTVTQCNTIQSREILCEKNGKFAPSGKCAGGEICTGPISSYAAECGKTKLCEPSTRITLLNLRAYDYIQLNISMNEIILNGFFLLETCFNKKKDNGEEGVDCGGPCRLKCVGMRFLSPFYDPF